MDDGIHDLLWQFGLSQVIPPVFHLLQAVGGHKSAIGLCGDHEARWHSQARVDQFTQMEGFAPYPMTLLSSDLV